MHKIVLLRHGESVWNRENRFTGWMDVDLTDTGVGEAKEAADLMAGKGMTFDYAFTSPLKRAVKSLWIVLEKLDLMWIPIEKHWRLNERHYGALQGLNKKETAAKFGEEQVFLWRRSFDVRPPFLDMNDPRHPRFERKYRDIDPQLLPAAESLKDTCDRVIPYWQDTVVPMIKKGKHILISAHGNSMRAIVKYLDNTDKNDIVNLNIPTGVPLIYELDEDLQPTNHYYLGDPAEIERKIEAMKSQIRVFQKIEGDVTVG